MVRPDPHSLATFLQGQMPAALDMLRRMVEINSFTGNRAGVNRLGDLTVQCFAPLGFTAARVPSSNPAYADHLIVRRGGRSGRSVAMISHLDTVFPPEEEVRSGFRWQREGDRIYGPGTHDIKGGTVMMWLVLSALRAHAPSLFDEVGWDLCFNSSEEVLSHDFGELCRRQFQPGTVAALVFEAEGRLGEDQLLVVSRKGRATWRIQTRGRSAHAGGKHRHGASAITQLGHTLARISALTDYARDLTFNAGIVFGGSGLNRVPHEAFAEGELRAFTPEAFTYGKKALLALAGSGEVRSPADGYPCEVEVQILSETRPWPRNRGTDQLFELWQVTATELGMSVHPEERGGLSDGNFLWDVVPTIDGLGPWGDNDHCSERSADGSKEPEYVDVTSFVPKAVLNTTAILSLLTKT